MANPFFKNSGPHKINSLLVKTNIKLLSDDKEVFDVKDILNATNKDITFFHSRKYSDHAKKTKASYCITTQILKDILPSGCTPIITKNVLLLLSKITEIFYPESTSDTFDETVIDIKDSNLHKNVKFGKNVLVGKNVKIGKNCLIGHNTIIEKNVCIGENCKIGSNVIIKNSIIKNNVHILDGCVIGKKGFGFFPNNSKNIRYPQIGIVLINEYSEIGCSSIIDRGSLSNTVIGKNTYLDNQIHIAHNVKIGENCIIAGQVGFAGSSILGNNVMIGGQAGISGHLEIGNNVKIGGGSGVIKNIPDNSKVMGYPAKDLKNFIRENK